MMKERAEALNQIYVDGDIRNDMELATQERGNTDAISRLGRHCFPQIFSNERLLQEVGYRIDDMLEDGALNTWATYQNAAVGVLKDNDIPVSQGSVDPEEVAEINRQYEALKEIAAERGINPIDIR